MGRHSKDIRTIVIALIAGMIGANAPAIAHGVRHALFAHNADKVDGIHAAPATKPFAKRKGKLVATDKTTGLLPGDIIPAVEAATVDGKNASDFADAIHGHDAGDIETGTFADTLIPDGIMRDSEFATHNHDGGDINSGTVGAMFIDDSIARDTELPTAGSGLSNSGNLWSVNTNTIQARLSSGCSAGQFLQGISVTGTPSCAAPAGDITEVNTGTPSNTGLSGGVTSGMAFLSVDFNWVQRRVTGTCVAGQAIREVLSSGNVTCEDTGDIEAVNTGNGLTGGAISGSPTLSASYGGSGGDFGTANTLARSDHKHPSDVRAMTHTYGGVTQPSATLEFIAPPAHVTLVGTNQNSVLITSNAALGAGANPAGDLDIQVCKRLQPSGAITTVTGAMRDLTAGANERHVYSVTGIAQLDNSPGTWDLGMCGTSSDPDWTNNGIGITTALVGND